MTLFQLSYLLLWVLAILLVPVAVILLYLLAQLERLHRREGVGYGNNLIGRKFPAFSAVAASTGSVRPIDDYKDQLHVVLAVSSDCNTCRGLMAELASMTRHELSTVRLILLCMGDSGRCQEAVAEIGAVPVYIYDNREDATEDLRFAGFPAALVVDESGMVVDVRHPLSIKAAVASIENATLSDRFHRAGGPGVATARTGAR
jgi:hypothetical protein